MLKRTLKVLLVLLLIGQFIRPAGTEEPVDTTADLIAVTRPDAELEHLLRVSCYTYHSGHPRYR